MVRSADAQEERTMRKLIVSVVFAAVLLTAGFQAGRHSQRQYIVLPRTVSAPFSDGVLVGDTLYLAGRIGLDKDGKVPPELEQEVRLALDGMKTTLEKAGMSMEDLVYVQVFCPDVSLFSRFNAVYRGYFGKDLPARAFIGSGALLFGASFEVQGIAVRR